jgi:hypothetical protein
MAGLILKRASASRPSGEWSEDDFDVLEDGAKAIVRGLFSTRRLRMYEQIANRFQGRLT